MAEQSKERASQIFNKRAAEKLRNPDSLDKYIKVTNPSVWLVLTACLLLLIGGMIWSFFGTVTSGVSVSGAVAGDNVVCFLNAKQIEGVAVGESARADDVDLTVSYISEMPLSRAEMGQILQSDYLTSILVTDDWAYAVYLTPDEELKLDPRKPVHVTISTESVSPVSLLFEK